MFDEISLEYWKNNRKKVGSSKSYNCVHNGYVYGDDMQYESIEFVYLNNGNEQVIRGQNSGPKWAYLEMVEKACQQSSVTFHNFSDTGIAEKFRIYTEAEVKAFSVQRINSTRIKNGAGRITINGNVYYAANNLKLCEYFNNAANCIDPNELSKWHIRITFIENIVKPMTERDEAEVIEDEVADKVSLKIHTVNDISSSDRWRDGTSLIVNIDYTELNNTKKRIGDIGEELVVKFERQRLEDAGHSDYASSIEHSSVEVGDGLGYDIVSYQEDGGKIYIEVKTTKQNKPAGFYLSKKEKSVADEMYFQGKQYKIYRVYNLNPHRGTGDLVIYEPPFTSDRYSMEPENWKVNLL